MKLSLCMIVKDEAEHGLEECLKSARPFVDQIVVVDTGSTDGSQEIAKQYADVFEEIEWPDDFSAARNYGLEFAEGDFIIYLDGDEVMENEDTWKKLRWVLEKKDPDGVALKIHNQLPGQQVLESDISWQVRVFRNHPDVRFRGAVHNQIAHAIAEHAGGEPRIAQLPSHVEHMGYSYTQEELTAKYEKRIHLLEREIEEAEEGTKWHSYYTFQLGNALFMLNEYDRCYTVLSDLVSSDLTDENAYSMQLMSTHCCYVLGVPDEIMHHSGEMLRIMPREAMSMFMHCVAFACTGDAQAALSWALAAMGVADVRGDLKYHVDPFFIASTAGELALKLNKPQLAKRMFRKHLEKYPDNQKVAHLESQLITSEHPVNGHSDRPIVPRLTHTG